MAVTTFKHKNNSLICCKRMLRLSVLVYLCVNLGRFIVGPDWSTYLTLYSAFLGLKQSIYSCEGAHALPAGICLGIWWWCFAGQNTGTPWGEYSWTVLKYLTYWQVFLICSDWAGMDPAGRLNWWMIFFPFLSLPIVIFLLWGKMLGLSWRAVCTGSVHVKLHGV